MLIINFKKYKIRKNYKLQEINLMKQKNYDLILFFMFYKNHFFLKKKILID